MKRTDNVQEMARAGVYLLVITLLGTLWYAYYEGFTGLDALYMTIITMSTVGFQEVHPISDPGKIFTIFLILSSLGVVAYFLSHITENFMRNQIGFFFGNYKRNLKRKKMKNHVIVCGYGRIGTQVVEELKAYEQNIVVIDNKHEVIVGQIDEPVPFIEGDSTEDEVLIQAGIKDARALITTLPVDADNLFVVLTARALNPDLNIISRASSESSERKLRMAGVDSVVTPERVGGAHMASLIAQPDVLEFLEHLNVHGDSPVQLMEIMCSNLPEKLSHKPISEIEFRKKTGANIIGYKTATGEYILNPSPSTKLIPDSKLFVLGTPKQIEDMRVILRGTISEVDPLKI
jgi:voltage-gated potassium channel